MTQLFSKIRAAFAAAPGAVPVQAHVIMTCDGLMVSHAWADGRFYSSAVRVPGAQGEWARGRPITLLVEETAGDQAGLKMVVAGGPENNEPILVYTGRREDVEQTAIAIQQAWIAVNAAGTRSGQGLAGGGNAIPPQWVAPGVSAYSPNTASMAIPPYHRAVRRSSRWFANPWLLWSVLAAVVVAAGWMGANHYLKPNGPGIDLSSMSVEDVARMDANPAAVRQVQDSLIEALGVGRAKAGETRAKIEQDHIDALKAMGLEPGVSMKNAMSCLAK